MEAKNNCTEIIRQGTAQCRRKAYYKEKCWQHVVWTKEELDRADEEAKRLSAIEYD